MHWALTSTPHQILAHLIYSFLIGVHNSLRLSVSIWPTLIAEGLLSAYRLPKCSQKILQQLFSAYLQIHSQVTSCFLNVLGWNHTPTQSVPPTWLSEWPADAVLIWLEVRWGPHYSLLLERGMRFIECQQIFPKKSSPVIPCQSHSLNLFMYSRWLWLFNSHVPNLCLFIAFTGCLYPSSPTETERTPLTHPAFHVSEFLSLFIFSSSTTTKIWSHKINILTWKNFFMWMGRDLVIL